MSYKATEFSLSNNVARITLNRPEAANTVNMALAKDLAKVSIECSENPEIRAVLLNANGKMFCAGGDLATFAGAKERVPTLIKELTLYFHAAVSRFHRMQAPMITAVHGFAAGGGLSLCAVGDYSIATETSKFTMAYTAAGLCPDGSSTYTLPKLIGLRRTKELMLLNPVLSSQEAKDWGLINEVVEDDALLQRAEQIAKDWAKGPTAAYGAVKRLLINSANEGLEAQMEHEAQEVAKLSGGLDGQEGINAFLEKRKPNFVGS